MSLIDMEYENRGNVKRWTFLLMLLVAGCSSKAIPPEKLGSAQVKFEQAESLVKAKDYAAALPVLDGLITEGLLSPDFSASSFVMRANCRLELGDLSGSLEDIDVAAMGVSDMSIIHGLRYKYWMKSGDPTKAQAELRLAQQLNPQFTLP